MSRCVVISARLVLCMSISRILLTSARRRSIIQLSIVSQLNVRHVKTRVSTATCSCRAPECVRFECIVSAAALPAQFRVITVYCLCRSKWCAKICDSLCNIISRFAISQPFNTRRDKPVATPVDYIPCFNWKGLRKGEYLRVENSSKFLEIFPRASEM